jgi:hypothetical protein
MQDSLNYFHLIILEFFSLNLKLSTLYWWIWERKKNIQSETTIFLFNYILIEIFPSE